jgi:hypothetical protein
MCDEPGHSPGSPKKNNFKKFDGSAIVTVNSFRPVALRLRLSPGLPLSFYAVYIGLFIQSIHICLLHLMDSEPGFWPGSPVRKKNRFSKIFDGSAVIT